MCQSFPGDPLHHRWGPTQNNIHWNMFPLVHSRESPFPMSEASIHVTNTSDEELTTQKDVYHLSLSGGKDI